MFINAALAAFNLLPAFPMDGGRVLRALLAMRFDYVRATEVAARIGQAIALLFAIVGVLMPNPILVVIALFVWMGAAGETGLAQIKRALRGRTVGTAMRTEFSALAPEDTLAHAAEMAIRHAQSDFPVLVDGRVAGLLTHHDLTRGLAVDGADRTAGEAMHRTFETVDASEPLDAVFGRLSQQPGQTLLVTDHGRLVGLMSLDEITNVLRLGHAVAARRHATVTPEDSPFHRRTGTRQGQAPSRSS
jgi:CBS domain-containing protein